MAIIEIPKDCELKLAYMTVELLHREMGLFHYDWQYLSCSLGITTI